MLSSFSSFLDQVGPWIVILGIVVGFFAVMIGWIWLTAKANQDNRPLTNLEMEERGIHD